MNKRPNLSIAHLGLWVTASSFYLVLIRNVSEFEPGAIGGLKLMAAATFAGAALSGALIVMARILKGKAWSTAPGEWLAFIVGTLVTIDAIVLFWPTSWRLPAETIVRTTACLAMVLPMLSRRLTWPWKAYFVLMVCFQCLAILVSVRVSFLAQDTQHVPIKTFMSVRTSVALTVPLALAIWERKDDEGWLHWLGLTLHTVWCAYLLYSIK